MIKNLFKLWSHFDSFRKRQFSIIVILIIATSFAEILSIGSILPFVSILLNPSILWSSEVSKNFINKFGINSNSELLILITVLFILAALLAGFTRLALLWLSNKLSYSAGADLSMKIYKNALYQSYEFHIAKNTSEIIDGIINKSSLAIFVINSVTNFISSMVILFALLVTLIYINPIVSIGAFSGFGGIYFIISIISRNKLEKNSNVISAQSKNIIRYLQEGLGGIREIIINQNQDYYCGVYKKADIDLRNAQAFNSLISFGPRYAIESLGVTFIAIFSYILVNKGNDVNDLFPLIGAIAMGTQRILPLIQQAYSSYSNIKSSQSSINETLILLEQKLPEKIDGSSGFKLEFNESIILKNISFSYKGKNELILEDVNLQIKKGKCIGIIGASGSGKSTLLDLVTGLLTPSSGMIMIDGKQINKENYSLWQKKIAYVPQFIYLSDGSFEENIAFGINENMILSDRVYLVPEKVKLAELIENSKDKFKTKIGERGVRLSGGQRQRIGIARALYKNAELLILDEATSSLDNETESSIMDSIENLRGDITMIIVSHRETTLRFCDEVYKINNKKIIKFDQKT